MKKQVLWIGMLILLAIDVFAQEFLEVRTPFSTPFLKTPSPLIEEKIAFLNQRAAEKLLFSFGNKTEVLRPYAEYETAGTLLFNFDLVFGSSEIKKQLLAHLPAHVEAKILYTSPSQLEQLLTFETDPENPRANPLQVQTASAAFWTRDALPIPVFLKNSSLGLVDAPYYHSFSDDQAVATHFGVPLLKHEFFFEGGNFLADQKGNCFIVNNTRVSTMPDEVFQNLYGCQSLHRFKHLSGIGHIDERVKFLSDSDVITDEETYVETLEQLGYTVTLFPRPLHHRIASYINSLLIDGTLFLPNYQSETDQKAIDLYEGFGLQVVPLDASHLVRGMGSIHCITMTYPPL